MNLSWNLTVALLLTAPLMAEESITFGDYRNEKPGVHHKITVADLPAPYATKAVDRGPRLVRRPSGTLPLVKEGFRVDVYATGLKKPRLVRRAPNGDLFVAESESGRISVLRGTDSTGRAQQIARYASGLKLPFGIAFYPLGESPKYVYIANTDSVVRFVYQNGDIQARAKPEMVVPDLPGGGRLRGGGHWTRDIVFSPDGKQMFVSVGSLSNVDDTDNNPKEKDRAAILVFDPEGKGRRVFASGIRNPVGIEIHPSTGELWTSVNE